MNIFGKINIIMRLIYRVNYSFNKTYYPFFLSPSYKLLSYSNAYLNHVHTLQIRNPNRYQINDVTLPKFLKSQIEEDKTRFVKEKQFLFIGRSNSGKSSLINQIFGNPKIARKAKNAGTTKFLHFHQLKKYGSFVVDAPGYGFANMNKRRRHMWFGLTEEYMKISSRLSQIFLIVNFEHGLKNMDIEVLKRISKYNVDIQIVMNKVDKVKEQKFMGQLKSINEGILRLELPNINSRIIACSAKSKFGLQVLRCRVLEAIEDSRQRNIDKSEDLLLSYIKQMRISPTDVEQGQKQLTKQHIVRKLIYNSKLTQYLV